MSGRDVNVRITATDEASGVFRTLKAEANAFGVAIGASVSVATGVFLAMVKNVIADADALKDMSERTGVAIASLASYKLVAEQSGTSLNGIALGLNHLSGQMLRHGKEFRALGIDTQDADKALRQIADTFKSMPDGMEKTALAIKLFGRSGAELIPLLNQGSAGLDEAAEKSRKYAEAMKTLAPEADKYGDSLSEMSILAQAAAANIAGPLVGALNGWTKDTFEAIKIAGSFTEMLRLFVFNLDAMTTEKPIEEIRRLTRELKEYQETSDLGKFFKSPFGGLEEDHKKKIAFLQYLNNNSLKEKYGWFGDARDLLANPPIVDPSELSGIFKKKEKAGAGKAAKWAQDPAFLAAQQAALAGESGLSAKEVMAQLHAEDKALESLRQKYIDIADPLQKYRDQLEEINRLRESGALTSAQAIEAEWAVNAAMDETLARMTEIRDTGKDSFDELARAIDGFSKAASNAFADFLASGMRSFSDLGNFADNVMRQMISMTANELLFKPMFDDIRGLIKPSSGVGGGGNAWTWLKGLFRFADGGIMTGAGPLPLQRYASGGIANSPQLALFGEGATNEAYVPLPDGRSIPVTMRGGASTIVVNVNTTTGDRAEIRRSAAAGARAALGMLNGARRYG